MSSARPALSMVRLLATVPASAGSAALWLGLHLFLPPAFASDRAVVVERASNLPMNPRLAWDSSADPPRPLWFVRDWVSGPGPLGYPLFVASSELWKNLAFDRRTYPHVVQRLEGLAKAADGGPIRHSEMHRDWTEGISEETRLDTPELADRNVHLAALFRVVAIEPGLDGQALATNMLTLEPLEWFRGEPVDGPYFLVVPAVSVRVGPFVVIDSVGDLVAGVRDHPLQGSTFWPVVRVGDHVVVLESRPSVGPPRMLTTAGFGQQNLVVLGADGVIDHSSGFPLDLRDSTAAEALGALRALFGRTEPAPMDVVSNEHDGVPQSASTCCNESEVPIPASRPLDQDVGRLRAVGSEPTSPGGGETGSRQRLQNLPEGGLTGKGGFDRANCVTVRDRSTACDGGVRVERQHSTVGCHKGDGDSRVHPAVLWVEGPTVSVYTNDLGRLEGGSQLEVSGYAESPYGLDFVGFWINVTPAEVISVERSPLPTGPCTVRLGGWDQCRFEWFSAVLDVSSVPEGPAGLQVVVGDAQRPIGYTRHRIEIDINRPGQASRHSP